MSNPYSGKPDYAFWSRSVSPTGPGMLDPMTKNYIIHPRARIATMGSCFAQHLSRYIAKIGLNYYIEETAPQDMDETQAAQGNYGVFSARYGNIYTVRQALQLLERALGRFQPVDSIWEYQGGFVDAFRPRVEQTPFKSPETVIQSRTVHLNHVRNMFQKADWLVLTLGLTEAWTSHLDGTVYPMAPGIHGGAYSKKKYQFINFSVQEVIEDLRAFIRLSREVNPGLKFILTVSPVPLIATFEDRHVIVSTVCSKAILRTAADAAEREFEHVVYFPSYEIITNPVIGSYFMDDLREVTPLGVKHVMKIFSRHFTDNPECRKNDLYTRETLDQHLAGNSAIVCDEEEIERALIEAGVKRK